MNAPFWDSIDVSCDPRQYQLPPCGLVLRCVDGIFTAYSGSQAVMTFASLERALEITGLREDQVTK